MTRPTLRELETRCQKLDHRRLGNWMARRVTRPLALRVTWLLLPTGLTAHRATLAALLAGIAAAATLATGTGVGWLAGALLLQLWYLLDHVDGQLARYRGSASLDGVQIDYLMHHTVNLATPLGIGYGLSRAAANDWPLLAGVAMGAGLLWIGLVHDTRYKAFVQRLKVLRGELLVVGGGGGRPTPAAPPPLAPLPLFAWLARKSCEMHVIMNVLTLGAMLQWLVEPSWRVAAAQCWLVAQAVLAVAVAVFTVARGVIREASEQEFAKWYRVPDGGYLRWEAGWLHVEGIEPGAATPVSGDDARLPSDG